MPHHVGEHGGDVAWRDGLHEVLAVELPGHEPLEFPLVEPRVVEGDRERPQRVRRLARRERAADRGIQPAAQIAADGDVRAQAQAHTTREQPVEGREGLGGLVARLRILEVVVAAATQPPVLPDGEPAGLEGVDSTEHGARRSGGPEREHLVEPHGVGRRLDLAAREQGLRFRGKHQVPAHDAVEERAHPEPVPGEQHGLMATVVNRERELPVQATQHPGAPLLVRVHQHLGIAARAKAMPGPYQLRAQLQVVIDLAVVHDEHSSIFVAQRLGAAGDVDDAEAHVGQTHALARVPPAAVGTAMPQRGRHAVEGPGGHTSRLVTGDPGKPAHQSGS